MNEKKITMDKLQFKNFNLFTFQYPLTAITSILHRLSGIFVFLFVPFILWLFDVSVGTVEGFEHIQLLLTNVAMKFIIWLILVALGYHLLAGIRHLLMDVGVGEDLRSGRLSAKITIGITIIWTILIGMWLW
jgi:succinate dehydrogenase / fumarate reductase cytochrome b subunit